ncbi:hypothetical protein [Pseudobacter ginsenosidimutans]|uniref:Uncharacterized protein n=1 Tax=Pseudobacter ginsenosidimutans TaxID=661488 RepID=A0A4Q7MK51_9BACT|nr:hypothetical protein [Pseudobacter ginsenosidimutans]QEC45420.1 hypothetical protein FSB84_28390 [Pseudobacter ginsenosidimutans]RZS66949.1 hypothetical protein EV199_5333 [Pseudobacter ginsenosidimutans]
MSKLWVAFLMLVSFSSFAQDTLPRFTVTTRGYNKAIISWTNNYTSVTQINVQRSFDSSKGFRTILNVPDPTVPQNGFVDTKAPAQNMFYRLFIVLEDGNYIFSPAQRPYWDTLGAIRPDSKEFSLTGENNNRRIVAADNMSQREVEQLKAELREATKKATAKPNTSVPTPNATAAPKAPERYFIVKKKDSILFNIPEKGFKKFRDSIVYRTKDTMAFKNLDTIVLRPFIPREIYKPSRFVYTDKDGNVVIDLYDALKKDYEVKFFDEKQTPIFDIHKVKDPMLIIDKVTFLRSGWYRFELYEEGKLKETHKVFIPKDF